MSNSVLTSSIGVIGGGWFGQAFAKNLVREGNSQLTLTTQTVEKLSIFNELGVKGELLSFPIDNFVSGGFENYSSKVSVFDQDVLIIAIPPGFKKGRTDYADNIAEIVALAEKGNIQQLILLNSTAIYNGLTGEVDEGCSLELSANKVGLLAQAETELFKFNGKACSLRLAGLVGGNRHPGTFVETAIKQNRKLPEPNAHVNLIHQVDVIGLVKTIISKSATGIFTGVSATNITKEAYYQAAAESISLSAPLFAKSTVTTEESKKVKGDKTRQLLQYKYQYDNLITWLVKK